MLNGIIAKKKWIALLLSVLLMFSFTTPVFANAIQPSNTYESISSIEKVDPLVDMEPQGIKKTLVVNALKYGGELLGNMVSMLSKENGDLLKKNAYIVGDFLDSITNSFEARLIDFMIFELGFPSSAARTIAWVISSFLL